MSENSVPIEILWEQLLSRKPSLIQQAFAGLTGQEQEAVLAHLKRMAEESGWHPEQRISAQAALDTLQKKN